MNSKVHSNNALGVKGVHWNKYNKKWHSQIMVNKKVKHLGYFDNIEEAKLAREIAAKEYNKEFYYDGVSKQVPVSETRLQLCRR